jgi:hypothetical protein
MKSLLFLNFMLLGAVAAQSARDAADSNMEIQDRFVGAWKADAPDFRILSLLTFLFLRLMLIV